MSASNSWAEFAGLFRSTRDAFLDHERAKSELKALMPEDAKEAVGHGVRGQALKIRRGELRLVGDGARPCRASSESIAALASALAKAQAELVNPEKSLTATIRGGRPGERERSFRYAPLSSGLDIVRKTLGQHEIATVQTTAIDSAAGMVNLTTTLAHASGEWIASDWPVCPITETTNPQRMGAALTYARRYALFTLVGIAGEDDLDAPNLNVTNPAPATTHAPVASGNAAARKVHAGNGRAGSGFQRPQTAAVHQPILAPDKSAWLRDAMLAEIESITSSTAAAAWAATMLRSKNTLTADDARSVEVAFEAKLAGSASELAADISAGLTADTAALEPMPDVVRADSHGAVPDVGAAPPAVTIAGSLNDRKPIPKTVRHRNKEHLKFVGTQPCLICAKQPSDPHHVRFAQPRALGRKVSDEYTVPLCRSHHREVHRAAKELAWWQSRGIAPLAVAETLWQKSQSGQALNEPLPPLTQPPQTQTQRAVDGNGLALKTSVAGTVILR